MRAIGMAERAYELMCQRALTRKTFGQLLARHGMAQQAIALSRIAIDQSRLLVLDAAHTIDTLGNRAARTKVAMVKVAIPRAVQEVRDKTGVRRVPAAMQPPRPWLMRRASNRCSTGRYRCTAAPACRKTFRWP